MEIKSFKSLAELAGRTEELALRLQQLDIPDDAPVPNLPLPLTLSSMEDWVKSANECISRPRVARSKLLLESKGIDTVDIPAVVLDEPVALNELTQQIDNLPVPLQAKAWESVGRALTKTIVDAQTIVARYCTAAELMHSFSGEAVGHEWICELMASPISDNPDQAVKVAASARTVLGLCVATERLGITFAAFASLDQAGDALTNLGQIIANYDQLLTVEGLSGDRPNWKGLDISAVIGKIHDNEQRIKSEKSELQAQLTGLASQLARFGTHLGQPGNSVTELRDYVRDAQTNLKRLQTDLQSSLGEEAFEIVVSLLDGTCPPPQDADDSQLGNALRRAIDCGYSFQLEAPHEGE